jgi:hypothetical protein
LLGRHDFDFTESAIRFANHDVFVFGMIQAKLGRYGDFIFGMIRASLKCHGGFAFGIISDVMMASPLA